MDMTGLHMVIAGAALGNGNRGVEALARSVIGGIARQDPDAVLGVLDDGWGVRRLPAPLVDGVDGELVGVRWSRRWHRPESWAQIRLAQSLGLRGNPVADRFARADAVLDISGGDSFTDLYGPARLAAVSAPKWAALRVGRPLVLLPQTYGPFRTDRGRRLAERIVRSATLAYTRDPWSHDRLLELAGPQADGERLRRGVDVAFALEPRIPEDEVVDGLALVADELTVGVNVSGLLRDGPAAERFGLAGDYVATMTQQVRELLAAGARVLLVPHVHAAEGGGESDLAALTLIRDRLTEPERARTEIVPAHLGAAELKWCIAQLDWFVGSRMHATIAALSTGTPVAAYAYSDKTQGVFDTCGVGEHVVDARRTAGPAAVAAMMASFHDRQDMGAVLLDRVPGVVEQAREQLSEVVIAVGRWREGLAAEPIA